MAVITFPAKKANKVIEFDTRFETCCGQSPESWTFVGRDITDIALKCHNPECPNYETVFESESGIAQKWQRYRHA